ncbi:MAG: ABC transporter substrate-binding protein [Oscillospiraceae bacterium]|jgi:iron complex transport system substrate-binding protein|nr:ABC transporter substrate-binding protein [Oscillospiraceae bacterium]
MKKTKILSLLLALLMLSATIFSCAKKPASITITDMTGREVTLKGPAERIVALTASTCEIVYALGAGDKLVGRGSYCNYPAEALEIEAVTSGYDTNIEQIIALTPDLVLMSTMAQSEEQIAQLSAAGIAVVVTDATTIDETYTSIEELGKLLGADAAAKKIVDDMKKTFADLSAKAAAAPAEKQGKSIYFEVSPLQYGLWTAGTGTFMDEVANLLDLENAFGDVADWAEVSEEQVLSRNPDYILTVGMYFGDGPTPDEEILGRAGWENVTAVKNVAILNLQADELSRPGPRLALGAQLLYDFVYGE